MATCPKGHESATLDYCDQCGRPMDADAAAGSAGAGGSSGGTLPPAAAFTDPPATETPAACPLCRTAKTGRFCEVDGYDFLLAPPVDETERPPTAAGAAPAGVAPAGVAPAVAAPRDWYVVVSADRSYFDAVVTMGGEDAGALAFPRFVPDRRFPLRGGRMLIGRRSRSRGVEPDIDLVGPPEDPGVSHSHALFIEQPDGWAIVDLESANGTYVNDPSSAPIDHNEPVPLKDGDRVYVGAWTALTIHAA